jgi:sodium-coupled neutral amino acid transporter 9
MDFRLRYYGRIEQSSGGEISLSEVPQHLVPPEFYQLHILDSAKEGSKTSSIMTIFSVWNTMMGSGLLTLPWGFSEAGLVGGTAVVIIVGLLAWYTCYIVLNYGIKYGEFMDMTREYFGKVRLFYSLLYYSPFR